MAIPFPTLITEAAFPLGTSNVNNLVLDDVARGKLDTAQLGGDLNWVDITAYLRTLGITRGATRVVSPVIQYEAGKSTVLLDNRDRRFERTNLSGPYVAGGVSQVRPMVAIRHRATWAGVTYPLWRGFADFWKLNYFQGPDATCTLTATDAFKAFEANERVAVAAVGGGELAGARVNRILTSAGWEATAKIVDTGDTTLQSTTLEGSVLAELQLVSDTELGELYMDGNGRVVFRHRHAIIQDTRSAIPQATFANTTPVMLTGDNSTFESSIGTWAAESNAAAPTRTTAQAQTGVASMLMSSSASGDMAVRHAAAPAATNAIHGIIGGAPHTATASFRAATSARSCQVRVNWYDATGAFISTSTGSSVTDSTSGWGTSTLAVTSPTNAALAVVLARVQATAAANEQHYVDDVTFGGSELSYIDVETNDDDAQLVNRARITRVGGTEQVVSNAQSITDNLAHGTTRTDLLMQTDTAAFDYAGWLVFYGKDTETRFETLVINPRRDPDTLFPQVLGRELGDRITVIYRPKAGGTITQDVFIRGITHDINGQNRTWVTTWSLQAASKYSFLILDNAVLGKLDSNALSF